MQLGMIGLGRMGANIVRRLQHNGHQCVVLDRDPAAVQQLVSEGSVGTTLLDEFVKALKAPRAVWMMVPAAAVDGLLKQLSERLESGDIVIDGGNSYYIDDIRRSKELEPRGIRYLDVGTSGGVFGLERGFCQMIGGPRETLTISIRFSRLSPPAAAISSVPRAARRPPAHRKRATFTADLPAPAIS